MTKIQLNRADILEIQKFLDQNPKVEAFKLISHSESGIGYCLDIETAELVDGRMVRTTVELVGVENW